jgi:methyltransferase
VLAKSNKRWLLQNGAVEYGRQHYPFIVALHVLFLISLICEYAIKQPATYSIFLFVFYFLLLAFKAWVVLSLGKFWNTRIYHISNFPLIKKGPYKYFKHPNYLVVIAEIAIIPLAFHLYFTAVIFSVLNAVMLYVRIREENRALEI